MQDANPVGTFSKGWAGPRCSAFGVDSAPVPGTRSLEPGTGLGITSSGPSPLSQVPSDRLRPNLCLTRPAPPFARVIPSHVPDVKQDPMVRSPAMEG